MSSLEKIIKGLKKWNSNVINKDLHILKQHITKLKCRIILYQVLKIDNQNHEVWKRCLRKEIDLVKLKIKIYKVKNFSEGAKQIQCDSIRNKLKE